MRTNGFLFSRLRPCWDFYIEHYLDETNRDRQLQSRLSSLFAKHRRNLLDEEYLALIVEEGEKKFSLDQHDLYEQVLNAGYLNSELITALQTRQGDEGEESGLTISEQVTVNVRQAGLQWALVDPDVSEPYVIWKEKEGEKTQLTIYSGNAILREKAKKHVHDRLNSESELIRLIDILAIYKLQKDLSAPGPKDPKYLAQLLSFREEFLRQAKTQWEAVVGRVETDSFVRIRNNLLTIALYELCKTIDETDHCQHEDYTFAADLTRLIINNRPTLAYKENIDRLANYLHLDLTIEEGHPTTPMSFATSRLQSYVESVRLGTENLERQVDSSSEVPTGGVDETIWAWLKNYSTWHSAMMVNLYPENFLIPKLRDTRTPQFTKLLEELETTSSQPAALVEKYVEEIKNLRGMTVEGVTTIDDTLLIFGQSSDSQGLYYSVLFPNFLWRGWERIENFPTFQPEDGDNTKPRVHLVFGPKFGLKDRIYVFTFLKKEDDDDETTPPEAQLHYAALSYNISSTHKTAKLTNLIDIWKPVENLVTKPLNPEGVLPHHVAFTSFNRTETDQGEIIKGLRVWHVRPDNSSLQVWDLGFLGETGALEVLNNATISSPFYDGTVSLTSDWQGQNLLWYLRRPNINKSVNISDDPDLDLQYINGPGREDGHTNPQVAMDSKGNYTVVYRTENEGIQVKRFHADHSPSEKDITIQEAESTKAKPAIGMDEHGNFLVAWRGGGHRTIELRCFTADGDQHDTNKTITGLTRLDDRSVAEPAYIVYDSPSSYDSFKPGIAIAGRDNQFVVTWATYAYYFHGGRYFDVWVKGFEITEDTCKTIFKEERLDGFHTHKTQWYTHRPAVAFGKDRTFALAYSYYDGAGRQIRLRGYKLEKNSPGDEFYQLKYLYEKKITQDGYNYYPALHTNGDDVVVAWSDNPKETDDDWYGIAYRGYSLNDGSPLFDNKKITVQREKIFGKWWHGRFPSVAITENQSVLVAYQRYQKYGEDAAFLRGYDSEGNSLFREVKLGGEKNYPDEQRAQPAIALHPSNNNSVVVWMDKSSSTEGDKQDIRISRYKPSVNVSFDDDGPLEVLGVIAPTPRSTLPPFNPPAYNQEGPTPTESLLDVTRTDSPGRVEIHQEDLKKILDDLTISSELPPLAQALHSFKGGISSSFGNNQPYAVFCKTSKCPGRYQPQIGDDTFFNLIDTIHFPPLRPLPGLGELPTPPIIDPVPPETPQPPGGPDIDPVPPVRPLPDEGGLPLPPIVDPRPSPLPLPPGGIGIDPLPPGAPPPAGGELLLDPFVSPIPSPRTPDREPARPPRVTGRPTTPGMSLGLAEPGSVIPETVPIPSLAYPFTIAKKCPEGWKEIGSFEAPSNVQLADHFVIGTIQNTVLVFAQTLGTGIYPISFVWSMPAKECDQTLQAKDFTPLSKLTLPSEVMDFRSDMDTAIRYKKTEDHDLARIYLDEYFLHVPMTVSESLNASNQYKKAMEWLQKVQDPILQQGAGDVVPSLFDGSSMFSTTRRNDETLNPYHMADQKQNRYREKVVLAHTNNLLDWADHVFAQDTFESVNQGRELYELAAIVLNLAGSCTNPREWKWEDFFAEVSHWSASNRAMAIQLLDSLSQKTMSDFAEDVTKIFKTSACQAVKLAQLRVANTTTDPSYQSKTIGDLTKDAQTGIDSLDSEPVTTAQPNVLTPFERPSFLGSIPQEFNVLCSPKNPLINRLQWRIESNLAKIRTNRNFVGIQRQFPVYTPPPDVEKLANYFTSGSTPERLNSSGPPPLYRYPFLLNQAKSLASVAQQTEATMLASLEKLDAASYTLLKAKQDIRLEAANVTLQGLRQREAGHSHRMAQLQLDRSEFQFDYYQGLLDQGQLGYEKAALRAQTAVSAYRASAQAASTASLLSVGNVFFGLGFQSIAQTAAASAEAVASIYQTKATFARRKQDWRFQRGLAQTEIRANKVGVLIAQDQMNIVEQEQKIAQTRLGFSTMSLSF